MLTEVLIIGFRFVVGVAVLTACAALAAFFLRKAINPTRSDEDGRTPEMVLQGRLEVRLGCAVGLLTAIPLLGLIGVFLIVQALIDIGVCSVVPVGDWDGSGGISCWPA